MLLEVLLLDGEAGRRVAAGDQGRRHLVRALHGARLREHDAPVTRLQRSIDRLGS